MIFYERIMGYTPENIWTTETLTVLALCLYWNGFPTSWTLADLWDYNKFPIQLPKKEQGKEWAHRRLVLDMMFEMIEKIRRGHLKGSFHDENDGPYFLSPVEFLKYANSRGYDPRDLEKVRRDQTFAPQHIQSAIHQLQKRKTPALASPIVHLRGRKIPKCPCGKITCCVRKVLEQAVLPLHREQIKNCAKKIDIQWMATNGRKPTPSEIFYCREFQLCLKKLRHPVDKELIVKYPDSIILKNWIPQAVGIRASRGRPAKRKG